MPGFGSLFAFLSSWGGSLPPSGGPFLVSSTPADGDTSVLPLAAVSFVVDSPAGIELLSLGATLDGLQCILAGAFLPGYTGTVVQNGTTVEVTFFTYPPFLTAETVYCVIYAEDSALTTAVMSFKFSLNFAKVSNLLADADCLGRKVNLSWTSPAGATWMLLMRSRRSFCLYPTDPGDTLYSGAPISSYADSAALGQPLEENAFYYYTLFVSYNAEAPFTYHTGSEAQVIGLSIKDYAAAQGNYVYESGAYTAAMRGRDADPTRGTDRFLLKRIAGVIQCGFNLLRGYTEALLHFRNPEEMPTGQVGIAENQLGIISAQCWDLDFPVDRSYDAGMLRRVVSDVVRDVYQVKGTCPSLVNLTRIMTTWTARCDELLDPRCGVNRLFNLYDGESQIQIARSGTAAPGVFTSSSVSLYDGITPSAFFDVADYAGCFVIDAMGTFACVHRSDSAHLYLEDPAALLRAEITGQGASFFADQFTFNVVDTSAYPWQFPSPAPAPVWGHNAWAGCVLMDATGAKFPITGSTATDAFGATELAVTGSPATGVCSIAKAFSGVTSFAARVPVLHAKVYFGRFSLTYDGKWDARLLKEGSSGPWSLTLSTALTNSIGYSASPADVVMWVSGVVADRGGATAVGGNFVQDTGKAWVFDQWVGYYVNPNWNQARCYRIVSNTASQLTLDVSGNLADIADSNSSYVILSEQNALRYIGLSRVLPAFVPDETRIFVKFE